MHAAAAARPKHSTATCLGPELATPAPSTQCARFHPLDRFEPGMRSCRAQLARHAERRRKVRSQAASLPAGRPATPAATAAVDAASGSSGSLPVQALLPQPQPAALPGIAAAAAAAVGAAAAPPPQMPIHPGPLPAADLGAKPAGSPPASHVRAALAGEQAQHSGSSSGSARTSQPSTAAPATGVADALDALAAAAEQQAVRASQLRQGQQHQGSKKRRRLAAAEQQPKEERREPEQPGLHGKAMPVPPEVLAILQAGVQPARQAPQGSPSSAFLRWPQSAAAGALAPPPMHAAIPAAPLLLHPAASPGEAAAHVTQPLQTLQCLLLSSGAATLPSLAAHSHAAPLPPLAPQVPQPSYAQAALLAALASQQHQQREQQRQAAEQQQQVVQLLRQLAAHQQQPPTLLEQLAALFKQQQLVASLQQPAEPAVMQAAVQVLLQGLIGKP